MAEDSRFRGFVQVCKLLADFLIKQAVSEAFLGIRIRYGPLFYRRAISDMFFASFSFHDDNVESYVDFSVCVSFIARKKASGVGGFPGCQARCLTA
jgi:hypothetical protein